MASLLMAPLSICNWETNWDSFSFAKMNDWLYPARNSRLSLATAAGRGGGAVKTCGPWIRWSSEMPSQRWHFMKRPRCYWRGMPWENATPELTLAWSEVLGRAAGRPTTYDFRIGAIDIMTPPPPPSCCWRNATSPDCSGKCHRTGFALTKCLPCFLPPWSTSCPFQRQLLRTGCHFHLSNMRRQTFPVFDFSQFENKHIALICRWLLFNRTQFIFAFRIWCRSWWILSQEETRFLRLILTGSLSLVLSMCSSWWVLHRVMCSSNTPSSQAQPHCHL